MSSTPRVRASVVCRTSDRLLVVRLRDPHTEVEAIFPPGGAVEEGETPAEAAAREALEETGLRVRVDAASLRVETYPYRWDGKDYDVTTHYFMAALDEPFVLELPKVVDAPYNLGAAWVPVSEALEGIPRGIALPVASMLRMENHGTWRVHPNIAGPGGTLIAVHDQFRHGGRRLLELVNAAPAADLGRLARAFAPLAETLHHHHHAEEAMLFPAVEKGRGSAPTRLVEDHAVLMRAIADVEATLVPGGDVARARAAAEEFSFILTTHLDREEELVVPFLLSMRPHEAWDLIHGAIHG